MTTSETQPATWPSNPVAAAVIDAFMLGWDITELKARMAIANALTQTIGAATSGGDGSATKGSSDGEPEVATGNQVVTPAGTANLPAVDPVRAGAVLGDGSWLGSKWRGVFVQIASLHCRRFPQSTTERTFYQPPSGRWADMLAYLYPQNALDDPPDPGEPPYAAIGIVPFEGTPTSSLNQFKLYDATRRAVNCLIVLYASSKDGLIADVIRDYQAALIDSVRAAVPGAVPAGADEAARRATIGIVTLRAIQLLEAWESYLREQYYAGGTLTDNTIAEQQGFEAGCALAGLAWDVSVATTVDECRTMSSGDGARAALGEKLHASWKSALRERNIVAAQHAIAALSTTLDNAYVSSVQQAAPPALDGSSTFNPELPSNVCSVINRSLDFWQRAVEWLGVKEEGKPRFNPDVSGNLHTALIAQSNVWQGLMTGQQSLRAYTVETVMHQLMRDVSQQFETDATARLQAAGRKEVGDMVRELAPAMVLALATLGILLIIAVVWVALTRPNLSSLNPNGIWSLVALGPILAGAVGLRAARTSGGASAAVPTGGAPAATGPLLEGLGSWAARASELLLSMWQAAYRQLRLDLAILNHVVGTTYPLIECFVLSDDTHPLGKIKSDYAFVDTVIWSTGERRQEIEDIVTAAMQPLRAVIDARVATLGSPAPSSPSAAG